MIKHIFRVHQRVMNYESTENSTMGPYFDQTVEEEGFSDVYPKDYDLFKNRIQQTLTDIDEQVTLVKDKTCENEKELKCLYTTIIYQ